MNQEIPEILIEKIDYVASYVGNTSNDWFRIKKELINCFPIQYRNLFSRRHKTSKKFFINDFDKTIINYLETKLNTKLFIDENKLHKPEDERPPRYWGLMKYNKERTERKNGTKE